MRSIALDEILAEIETTGQVELDDPLNEGGYYRLSQRVGDGPRLEWMRPGDRFTGLCVRWWDRRSVPDAAARRQQIRQNFGALASAICSRLPVYEIADGVVFPPTQLHERITELATALEGPIADAVGPAEDVSRDAPAEAVMERDNDVRRERDDVLFLNGGLARVGAEFPEMVTVTLADGTVIRGRLTSLEMRIGG